MKKECANTRKSLRKYLHGHLFRPEKIKIERHLKSCPMCSSEYQALKRVSETKRILKDVTPPEGVVQRMKDGVSGLAKLKKILYRPLWVAGIVGLIAVVYINVITTRHRDIEIENIEKSLPTVTAPPAPPVSTPTVTPAPAFTKTSGRAQPAGGRESGSEPNRIKLEHSSSQTGVADTPDAASAPAVSTHQE